MKAKTNLIFVIWCISRPEQATTSCYLKSILLLDLFMKIKVV